MTAEEGADQVSKRSRRARNQDPIDARISDYQYTCESCGGHDFEVIHEYDVLTEIETTLTCQCGREEVAAISECHHVRTIKEFGDLETDHHFDWRDSEEVTQDSETEVEIICHKCHAEADETDWETDAPSDSEVDKSTELWEVRCATCNHEIEFGWSHPDRLGRIWPCESNDFNPWKSWPEPRFEAAWKRRGWGRPK